AAAAPGGGGVPGSACPLGLVPALADLSAHGLSHPGRDRLRAVCAEELPRRLRRPALPRESRRPPVGRTRAGGDATLTGRLAAQRATGAPSRATPGARASRRRASEG